MSASLIAYSLMLVSLTRAADVLLLAEGLVLCIGVIWLIVELRKTRVDAADRDYLLADLLRVQLVMEQQIAGATKGTESLVGALEVEARETRKRLNNNAGGVT